MKVAVSLAKNILASLVITVADSAIVAGIQKKYMVLNNNSDNFKWRNEWHNENYSSSCGVQYFIERIY